MEGENSTSGPQPYQSYEAELANSPISNTNFFIRGRAARDIPVKEGARRTTGTEMVIPQ